MRLIFSCLVRSAIPAGVFVLALLLPIAGHAQDTTGTDAVPEEPLIVVITPTPTDEPLEDIRSGYVVREDGSIFALADWILARLRDRSMVGTAGIASLFPDRAPPIAEWRVSEINVMIDGHVHRMTVAEAAAEMGLDLSRRLASSGDRVGIVNVGLDPSEYDIGNFSLGTVNLSGRPTTRF